MFTQLQKLCYFISQSNKYIVVFKAEIAEMLGLIVCWKIYCSIYELSVGSISIVFLLNFFVAK